LIDGETIATGTLSELYDKYCTSFFVEISFDAQADDDMSEKAVLHAFENVSMKASVYESLPYHIKFQVPMTEENGSKQDGELGQLAKIFSLLESKKKELNVKFYSVARMNLEQIFINLSRKQHEADDAFETERVESVRPDPS
jgi:hypothetical protein